MAMLDVVVVGKGLIGSAAARHLAEAGARVAIVGPDEPASYTTHDGVFASHYDQGRLAHRSARHLIWAQLAARSLAAYPVITARSGVAFYTARGTLSLVRDAGSFSYTAHHQQIERALGFTYRHFTAPAVIAQAFPALACPPGYQGLLDPAPAGFINPRALLRAELALAEAAGVQVVREIAETASSSGGRVCVRTRAGSQFQANALLVATGAFANCFALLPRQPAITVKSEVVTLGEVDAAGASTLADLPALLYDIDSSAISEIYLVPPVEYPNGRTYIKLGSNAAADRLLGSLAEIQAWMRAGDAEPISTHQQAAIEQLFPSVRFPSFAASRCLIARTPSGLPYIDQVDARTFVALGGNGAAAKSADTLGELAARLVLGQPWPAPFQPTDFKLITQA